jgi:uncharacterized protein (TIGR02453 family)
MKNEIQAGTGKDNPALKKYSLDFLNILAKNNNREWFSQHKDEYLAAHQNLVEFAGGLLNELNKHDKIETPSGKKSLFRIYKDVRFSRDKTPYNTHWSGSFRRATNKRRGGYYFHIKPGNSFLAGGFWGPNADDMKRIRQDIDWNYKTWKKMLATKSFIGTFGELLGDKVNTAPRGYSKDHPAIELLRYKQYLLKHPFSDKEVMSPDFVKQANDVFRKMRPFFDYMSEVLTTDLNGISLVD